MFVSSRADTYCANAGAFAAQIRLVLLAGLVVAHPAAAQSLPTQLDAEALREIIVTASKVPELLTETPLSISVLSPEQLENDGVTLLQNAVTAIPNLQFQTQSFNNSVQASIRGITSSEGGETAQPAVATYVDGVYIPRTTAISGPLFDIDRVEVLRGPQGTLYGMNSMAGNINIITAGPSPRVEASSEVGGGNFGDVETKGMLNVPLSDTFAVRLAFALHQNDGYIDSEGSTDRNYAKAEDAAYRITTLFKPIQSVTWRLSVDQFISNGTPWYSVITAPDGKPANGLSPYSFPAGPPEPEDHQNNLGLHSSFDWKVNDRLLLRYVAGVARADYAVITSWPAIPIPLGYQHSVTHNHNQYHEFNGVFDSGRLRNIAGASYSHESNNDYFDNPLRALNDIDLIIYSQASYGSVGVFDQATWQVDERTHLTAGVRYSRDHQDYPANAITCGLNTPFFGGNLPPGCSSSINSAGSGSWSGTTWKLGVDHDLNDQTLTYVSVATGYKAGGLNSSGSAQVDSQYSPEKVTNYELGLKHHLLDNRANFSASAFYMDYTNLQVTQFAALDYLTENAAKAANYGLETEGSWRMTHDDRVDGFATFLHATYKTYNNAVDQNTLINYPSLSGHFEPNAPEVSMRLHYAHEMPIGEYGKLSASIAVYWQAVSYLREFNLPIDRVPAYSKTILGLQYADPTDRWHVAVYVNDLENTAVRNGDLQFLGQYYSYYNPPRTFGIRVSYGYRPVDE